jgi:hypothetical protein
MMANVRAVFAEYVRALGGDNSAWTGRMEVMLVIEGRIRMLREIEGTSLTALSKEEVITTLESLLNSLGDRERVEAIYDMLDKWRKVRLFADQVGTESSFADAALEGTLPLHPSPPASPDEGQRTLALGDPSHERTVIMPVDPPEERTPE